MASSLPEFGVQTVGFELPGYLLERTIAVNAGPVNRVGDFVVCWLHHAVRDHENPALDVALTIGNELGKPLLVYLGMSGDHRFNSDRHVTFMLEGVRDLQRGLDDRGIAHAFFCPGNPTERSPLRGLASRAVCVVTEDFPAPPMPKWTAALAEASDCAVLAVDCDGLSPVRSVGRRFDRAFKFRDKMKKGWRAAMREQWHAPPSQAVIASRDSLNLGFEHTDLTGLDGAGLAGRVAGMDIDRDAFRLPELLMPAPEADPLPTPIAGAGPVSGPGEIAPAAAEMPTFEVTSIIASSTGSPMAVINGVAIRVGETRDGVTLVSVSARVATIRYADQTVNVPLSE